MASGQDIDIDSLERDFPPASGIAFLHAQQQAIDANLTLVQSVNCQIVQITPDGTETVIKQIDPPTPVERGAKIELP